MVVDVLAAEHFEIVELLVYPQKEQWEQQGLGMSAVAAEPEVLPKPVPVLLVGLRAKEV